MIRKQHRSGALLLCLLLASATGLRHGESHRAGQGQSLERRSHPRRGRACSRTMGFPGPRAYKRRLRPGQLHRAAASISTPRPPRTPRRTTAWRAPARSCPIPPPRWAGPARHSRAAARESRCSPWIRGMFSPGAVWDRLHHRVLAVSRHALGRRVDPCMDRFPQARRGKQLPTRRASPCAASSATGSSCGTSRTSSRFPPSPPGRAAPAGHLERNAAAPPPRHGTTTCCASIRARACWNTSSTASPRRSSTSRTPAVRRAPSPCP